MPINRSESAGFTFVELLVVVAIVLFLFSMMNATPTIAIEAANATRMGHQGKNIVTSIITANMDREAAGRGDPLLWPKIGQIDPRYSNSVFTATSKPNDYFAWLIEDHVVAALSDYHPFAGGGVGTAANGTDFRTKEHNVWNVVANLDLDPDGDPPFLFTRNFHPTAELLRDKTNRVPWTAGSCWHANKKPFGRNRAVVVTRGAAVSIIRGKDMTRARFLGDSVFNAATNRDVVLWYAVGAEVAPDSR